MKKTWGLIKELRGEVKKKIKWTTGGRLKKSNDFNFVCLSGQETCSSILNVETPDNALKS